MLAAGPLGASPRAGPLMHDIMAQVEPADGVCAAAQEQPLLLFSV